VQVDSIKLMLTAPGTKRLKLKYDTLLSNFAFKFNLRRYNLAAGGSGVLDPLVRRCRLTLSNPHRKRLEQRLKLELYEPLSSFAFQFNLRRYTSATLKGSSPAAAALVQAFSFFAISTSFLGFVLGLTDFLVRSGIMPSVRSEQGPVNCPHSLPVDRL